MTETTDCYDCDGAMRELDAFVRGELGAGDVGRMHRHFERCGHCKAIAQYEAAFRARLQALDLPCCPDALRTRIAALIAGEADAGA